MKSKFIIIITFIILFCLPYKSFATEYDINIFNGSGTSNAALINRETPFVANDVLDFSANLTATSNIEDIGNVALTIYGNNYSINGVGEYSGFTLGSGANYNIKQLGLKESIAGSNNGGAIYSAATATISGSTFTDNSAKNGGAIYNLGTLTISDGTSFSGNTANGSGGAIYNAAISTITNSNFLNNRASLYGGAIYNGGQLYLIADSDAMSFSGNTSGNETSNAIFTSGGSVGMNTGDGGYILFDDKLNASTRSTLSINNSPSYTNYGNVIFNNDISNYLISVYNGMLTLGEYGKSTIGYLNNSDYLTLSKGILNTANGVINTNYVGDFSSTTNAGILFDANLATGASDYLCSTGTTAGHLPIKGINILADGAHNFTILGSSSAYLTIDVSNFAAYTDSAKYTFVATATGGLTTTQILGSGGLNNAVSDTTVNKSYSAIADTNVSTNLGTLNGTMLTIFGNEKNITSSSKAGIIVLAGDTLNIYNVGTATTAGINGFLGANGAFVNNSGTTNIIDSTFTNNKATGSNGGAIYNNSTGTLNIADSYFGTSTVGTGNSATNGGAIYNGGTANIVNSDFEYNEAKTHGGAIYNVAMISCISGVFRHNSALIGGAISNTHEITKIASGTQFSYNSAYQGGAIFNGNIITSLGGIFKNNSATNSGGAIFNGDEITEITAGTEFTSNSSDLGGAINNNSVIGKIPSTTFTDNSATSGGAIYNSGTTTINNSTFTSNTATDYGGAIHNGDTLTISDYSIFENNSAIDGGAIYNLSKLSITNSTFENNFATVSYANSYGGAIYNASGINLFTVSDSTFADNYAKVISGTYNAYGGAIYNSGTNSNNLISNTLFTGNYTPKAAGNAWGGAIYNSGVLTIADCGFGTDTPGTGNYAHYGGAIYNDTTGTMTLNSGNDFYYNTAIDGSAILNAGTMTINSGNNFYYNTESNYGSAVYNSGNITISGCNFGSDTIDTGNSATIGGGAVFNNHGSITINSSKFYHNSAPDGGAVFNYTGSVIAAISDCAFAYNTTTGSGGAIANNYSTSIITSLSNDTFTGNSASAYGGAIYNLGTITSLSGGTFTSNTSNTSGGAIFNSGTMTVKNADFTNNSAKTNGGAIYNSGTLHVQADGGTSTFTGNNVNGASNAIYNTGTVYLDTGAGSSITFNDAITSSSNLKAININSGSSLNSGTVNFYNNITNSALNISGGTVKFAENVSIAGDKLAINGGEVHFYDQNLNTSNDINLNEGTLNLHTTVDGATYINDKIVGTVITKSFINMYTDEDDSGEEEEEKEGKFYINNKITNSTIKIYEGDLIIKDENYLSGDNMIFYGCNINTQNSLIGNLDLGIMEFTTDCDPHWTLDVDLASQIADSVTASSVLPYDDKKLTINSINLLSDSTQINTSVTIANDFTKAYIQSGVSSITTSLYKYDVTYDSSGGVLNFVRSGVSPGAVTSDVAQTQTFLLQTAIDRQFFANMESFMSFPLAQRESTICCALMNGQATGGACPISGNGTFSPIYSCSMNRGIWVKDFVSFENIPLRNGPNVSTVEYGTLIGMDAPLTYLKRGWVGNTSAFVGYLGSNQNYDSVGVSQNGVLVGLAENLVKGNNFLTLMASVGSSLGTANTPYGNDYFNSLFAGAAVKGGHNFEFKNGDYIIQPNLMLAYTFTHTPDYTAASGLNMTSQPLNAMQIAPGIRLIKNLKEEKGQVYLVGNFVYNVMDNTRFTANDVQLPQLSIAPYFEYGIGYQRVWENRLTGFFQTLLRGGGRNGIAIQFGLRWAI